ncbi:MAG: hypothetical protein U9O64_07255 [Campylobacterota bacterium]|nr:hypothetical protein [Campylobacterota bacterium]
MKKNKIFTKFVTLSLIGMSILYASRFIEMKNTVSHLPYSKMETSLLQEEIERRSQNGNLPFEMGLELIKRWSGNKEI